MGRAAGHQGEVRHVTGHDGPRADRGEVADGGARHDDCAGPDRAATPQQDGRDGPVLGPGQLTGGGDRAGVAVVGQDRAGADEHAVLDGHAVVDEGQVLDLDPVAQDHALVDEDVTADDAFGADPGTGPDLGAMPDAGAGTNRDVGLQVCRRVDPGCGINHVCAGLPCSEQGLTVLSGRTGQPRPKYTGGRLALSAAGSGGG